MDSTLDRSLDRSVGAAEGIDARVRARVRREGIDPQRQAAALRRVIEEEVRAHDERALGGGGEPVPDEAGAVAEIAARIGGFGPLQPLLDDPEVEEIWINAPDRVFAARGGVHELTTIVLDRGEVRELVERMLRASGRRLDLASPFVDARLPGGHRLHVVLEGIASGSAAVNIRKFSPRFAGLSALVEAGSLTETAAAFLRAAAVAGLTMVVSGGTQAGKTTMVNALADAVPGGERIISIEEVRELRLRHPDWVALECRQAGLEGTGEVSLRDLVRESLRMRPTRLIVGEVRGAEALDLLLAMNAGLPALATVHADSGRGAVGKLCTLPLLAGENVSGRFVTPTVAASVDLIVHLEMDARRRRRVREIAAVPGRVESGVIALEPLFGDDGRGLRRGAGSPVREELFDRSGIDVSDLLRAD